MQEPHHPCTSGSPEIGWGIRSLSHRTNGTPYRRNLCLSYRSVGLKRHRMQPRARCVYPLDHKVGPGRFLTPSSPKNCLTASRYGTAYAGKRVMVVVRVMARGDLADMVPCHSQVGTCPIQKRILRICLKNGARALLVQFPMPNCPILRAVIQENRLRVPTPSSAARLKESWRPCMPPSAPIRSQPSVDNYSVMMTTPLDFASYTSLVTPSINRAWRPPNARKVTAALLLLRTRPTTSRPPRHQRPYHQSRSTSTRTLYLC